MVKIRSHILNPLGPDKINLLTDHVIVIVNDEIQSVRPFDAKLDSDSEDRRDCLVLPGLIDLHVHLSQYRIRGNHRPALLPWLKEVVFPEEAKSVDQDFAAELAKDFFHALFRNGTTTSVIYTAGFKSACDTAFQIARELGARAFIGMTMMDQNSPKSLIQDTHISLAQSIGLFQKWNRKTPLLNYIFTPRFAPTCSRQLMKELGVFITESGAWLQTHLSENKAEITWVRDLFGLDSYTQVYKEMGLLGPRSILGHAIHLSANEIALLKDYDCKIAHCPDSNFYLKSGEFPYERIKGAGIEIGIGSDVGAGTTLNMLYHAKMANFRQSSYTITPERMLYHVTLGNAKILGLDNKIGMVEAGKQADIVLFKLPSEHEPNDAILSRLCFYGQEFSVVETRIAGKIVYSV